VRLSGTPAASSRKRLFAILLAGVATLAASAIASERASSEACGACHEQTHAEWAASGHAGAFTDRRFQLAHRDEPARWCLDCHAPLRDLGRADEGVGCAACHGVEGPIRSARRPGLRARLAHPVRYEPRLAEPEFCADCHEFTFPLHTPQYPFSWGDEPMQATLTEWRTSGSAESCQDCHMPLGGHRTTGAHDLALIRRTVSVSVEGGAVTLTADGAAHAVPTGDPFRRFVVELCRDEACTEVLARARFGRSFERTGTTWREVSDTRIPPPRDGLVASRTVEAALSSPARHYRLWYYVAESRLVGQMADDEFRHLIASGALP
jgi:hypothetical protein